MTIPAGPNRFLYAGNDTTGPWSFPAQYKSDDHIAIFVRPVNGVSGNDIELVEGVDYTRTSGGPNDPSGAEFTTTAPVPSGGSIAIEAQTPAEQTTTVDQLEKFKAQGFESALDDQALSDRYTQDLVERSVSKGPLEPGGGIGIENVQGGYIVTALDPETLEAGTYSVSVLGTQLSQRVRYFTITSTTNQIVLPDTPASDVIPSVNGVDQFNDAFTLVGDTITFTENLIAGDKVKVIYGIAPDGRDWIATDGTVPPIADIPWNDNRITELADPVDDQDAATKKYVDGREPIVTPEQFGAVGDGVTDDTAADNAARTAAGIDGEVYYKNTYLITSFLDRPLCRSRGPGTIKLGSEEWPAAIGSTPYKIERPRPPGEFGNIVVEDADYSAFPRGVETRDGAIVVVYHKGLNHGQSDEEAVCFPQTAGGAGNLTINGNLASGGIATIPGSAPPGCRVEINSVGNDSGITFTVTGLVGGVLDNEVVSGPNATSTLTTKRFQTVTQVSVSGATADDVTVGWFTLPGDDRIGYSLDGGSTWSLRTIGDGLTVGDFRYYAVTLGQKQTGECVVVYQKQGLTDDSVTLYARRSLDEFRTFGPEELVVTTGDPLTGTRFAWGEMRTTTDNKYYVGMYNAGSNGVGVSDDGVNWEYTEIVADGGTTYSEPAPLQLDHKVWVAQIRIDGVVNATEWFRSLDAGATWTSLGQTNLTPGGGYVSPSLNYLHGPHGTEVMMVLGERQTAVGTVSPNQIIARFAYIDDASSFATRFNGVNRELASFQVTTWAVSQMIEKDEYRYYAGDGQTYRALQAHTSSGTDEPTVGANWEDFWVWSNPRSGYPSTVVNPHSGEGLLFWSEETGYRQNRILCKRVPFTPISRSGYFVDTGSWTPTITGTTSPGSPAYTTQTGRYTRMGPMVFVEFDLRLSGPVSAVGALSIANLPFTCSTPNIASSKLRPTNFGTLTGVSGEGKSNAAEINLWHDTSGGSSTVLDSEVSNDLRIEGSLVYMTSD